MSQDSEYPLPQSAASIWFNGQSICIGFAPQEGKSRGHTVMIPLERLEVPTTDSGAIAAAHSGWATLLALLKERYSASHVPRIGERSEPSQYQLDRWLKANGLGSVPKERARGEAAVAVDIDNLGL